MRLAVLLRDSKKLLFPEGAVPEVEVAAFALPGVRVSLLRDSLKVFFVAASAPGAGAFASAAGVFAVLLRDSKKLFYSDEAAAGGAAFASRDFAALAFAASSAPAGAGAGDCAEDAQAMTSVAVASAKRPIVMAVPFRRQADTLRARP